MVRRKAAAIAGAAAVTAFAATVGLGANFGLFGMTQPDSRVGHLDGARPASVLHTNADAGHTDAGQDDAGRAAEPAVTTVPVADD